MARILGLDLGTNSLGWALIDDETHEVIDMGVRVFPEGYDNLGQGDREVTRNVQRRMARMMRRQIERKRRRKIKLLNWLKRHDLFPWERTDAEITTIAPYVYGHGGRVHDIFRLDSFRVGNELYRDVLLLQTLERNRFAHNARGMLKLYFAHSIGLVYVETEGYKFFGNYLLYNDNGERIAELGVDGVCDLEEPDPEGGYGVHSGTYRLVARGG